MNKPVGDVLCAPPVHQPRKAKCANEPETKMTRMIIDKESACKGHL